VQLLQEPGALEQWADELEGRSVRPTWTCEQQRGSVTRSPGREEASDQTGGPGGFVRTS
jgi:hypothetical protein